MMRRVIVAATAFAILATSVALGQSSPGFVNGQVLTSQDLNAAFVAKQDTLGFTPLNRAGGTMTGKLTTATPTTNQAGLRLPQGQTPSAPANGDLWITSSGFFAQVNGATVGPIGQGSVPLATNVSNNSTVGAYGDSLTFGTGASLPYPTEFSTLSGRNVYNFGVAGYTSVQILAAFAANTYTWGWPNVIWSGRNNYNTPTIVQANIASMVADMAGVGNTKYLVLGILNSDTPGEYIGQPAYDTIMALNAALQSTYGAHFFDTHAYLLTQGDGSPSDNADIANGVVPGSLRSDALHLNNKGYSLVAGQVFANIAELQSSEGNGILTTTLAQPLLPYGKSQLDLAFEGSYKISGTQVVYLPGQTDFLGSIAIGDGLTALSHSTGADGNSNSIFGMSSGLVLSTGYENSSIGRFSLFAETTGHDNTAIGFGTLQLQAGSSGNTAVGSLALSGSLTANQNTAVGFQAGHTNTSGNNNVFLGAFSGFANTTGHDNTAGGFGSFQLATTGNQNTAFGSLAAGSGAITGSNNSFFGNQAGTALTSGTQNTLIGSLSGFALTSPSDNTGVGFGTLQSDVTGGGNTAVGSLALTANTGTNNTAVGTHAGTAVTSGSGNAYFGSFSGFANITGQNNLGVGNGSLQSGLNSFNTAVGTNALQSQTSGSENVGVGYASLSTNLTGTQNTAVGTAALFGVAASSNVSGNTAVGYKSGFSILSGALRNTLIGYQTGYNLTTGNSNIYVGSYITTANANITTGTNNIIIGNDIQAPSATGSNQINIGNLIFATGASGSGTSIAGAVGIGTNSPAEKLEVAGNVLASLLRTAVVTVSGLPACNGGAEGSRGAVSDATAPTYLTPLTGGGTVHVGAYCNGTAWVAD